MSLVFVERAGKPDKVTSAVGSPRAGFEDGGGCNVEEHSRGCWR